MWGVIGILCVVAGIGVWGWFRLRLAEPPPAKGSFQRSVQLSEKDKPLSPKEFEEAVQLASHSNPVVRTHALVALAKCKGEAQRARALAIMRRALHDPSDTVCIFALRGLADLGDATDIPRVQPFLNHPNPLVRSRARKTLDILQKRSQTRGQVPRAQAYRARGWQANANLST